MERAAIDLGAGDNYVLFVQMITSRSYSDVMKDSDMKTRLRSPDDVDVRKQLALAAAKNHKEIIWLLHKMNRYLVLFNFKFLF